MRIHIKESDGKNISLRLPNRLMLNGLSAVLLSKASKRKNLNISAKQLRILFRAIKKYKRKHPKWELIEVHDHNGDSVEITL